MTSAAKGHGIILDLCGGTGAWSRPWVEAGFDVRVITMPEHDVRLFKAPKEKVYCVLAAPPCTMFCRMRMCRGRPTDEQFKEALSVVDACLRIIMACKPEIWALENPQGWLSEWLGEPRLKFQPWHYGDPWTKNTWIWGDFNIPLKLFPIEPKAAWVKRHMLQGQKGIARNAEERSITPSGFAKAFFEANRPASAKEA